MAHIFAIFLDEPSDLFTADILCSYSDLHNVILRGIRRFTEGQVFADDYSDFR